MKNDKELNWLKETKKLHFSTKTKLRHIACCFLGSCFKHRREKKFDELIETGSSKIEKMLDLRSIIKHERSLKSLLHLSLSKFERQMLRMQRSSRVLELSPKDGGGKTSDSDSSNDDKVSEMQLLTL